MKLRHQIQILLMLAAALLATVNLHAAPIGTSFTYQGSLNDGGVPANGSYDFFFQVCTAATDGSGVGDIVSTNGMVITNGLFTITLDPSAAGTYNVFDGSARWLRIAVRTNGIGSYTDLLPRQLLTPAPYAIFANIASNLTGMLPASQITGALGSPQLAGTYASIVTMNNGANSFAGNGSGLTLLNANNLGSGLVPDVRLAANVARTSQVWLLGGNSGTTPGAQFLGTADNQPVEIKVNGIRAMRLEPTASGIPNVLGGLPGNVIGGDVFGATIAGGGDTGGWQNTISGGANFASIGGGRANIAGAPESTVAGGGQNQAGGDKSAIGGGFFNRAAAFASVVGGGYNNQVVASYSTIGGGFYNAVNNGTAIIAGGSYNTNGASSGVIGGGNQNLIANGATYGTIAGGDLNQIQANAFSSSIGGGSNNVILADATSSTIAGGRDNVIQASVQGSTIGGGIGNQIQGGVSGARRSTIAGGESNIIEAVSMNAEIGGGFGNRIQQGANYTVVGGGAYNVVGTNAHGSMIGGGGYNAISNSAIYAAIPGGYGNVAGKDYAFAAGRYAAANHQGAFVWADSQGGTFASTANNQFLIRAGGNVGINKNNPSTALDVNGTITATSFSGNGAGLTGLPGLADNSVTAAKLASDVLSLAKVSTSKMSIVGGQLNLNDNAYLNDHDLYLRGDANHGLGWYGSGKMFAGANVNGPALYGNGGGVLGWRSGGTDHIALAWNDSGNIGIGANTPAVRLDVFGTNLIAAGVDGIVNIGNSAAAHLTLDADELQSRNGAGTATLLLNRLGGNVGIGTSSTSAKLDVNGDTRVRGVLRSGAENTGEAPNPAGLVVRRINSTQMTAGLILAKTRAYNDDGDITLERDGTSGGFLIRYPAYPGNVTIACMGMDAAGTPRNFYMALGDPSTAGTVQIYTTALTVVHFQCTFGLTYNDQKHLTQVTLSRWSTDNFWSGTLTSTYNQ